MGMYDVYLITANAADEDILINKLNNDIFITTYNVTTKTGKKEGNKLKSLVGAKANPCIVVYKEDKIVKTFYSEASTTVLADFLNWINETTSTIMEDGQITTRKYTLEERLNFPVKIKIVNKSNNELPDYADSGSAGMDLRADLTESITLQPLERKLIPTGLYIELPVGFEAQVRPRSGLALKKGITVLNTPGTIDSSYRGNIGVILINLSSEPFTVENGDRIAQMIIARHSKAEFIEVEELSDTERGEGGFGHTGVK